MSNATYILSDTNLRGQRRASQRFQQAQKMDAVGQLAGGMAHEFNNIFATIQLNSEMLEAGIGSDNKQLRNILRAAARGAELTRQLLAYSCRQLLWPCVLDLNTVLDAMMDPLMRTLGDRTVLEVRNAPELWRIRADPIQLETALINLVENARDAMPLGGRLIIETANVHLNAEYAELNPDIVPGSYVMVGLRDSGTGITPEVMDHVFEPFFTTKDVGQGVGLGLSMVCGFVKQSQGHVKIYSEEGQGTSVEIFLPVFREDAVLTAVGIEGRVDPDEATADPERIAVEA